MDLLGNPPYLGDTMMRRFLTLLAVLSGFAVIGAPVQAQPAQGAAAACEASAFADQSLQATPAAIANGMASKRSLTSAFPHAEPAALFCPEAPPVRLRIDRAHT